MTNKVKPFFIRITEDMTPQMVQDAFDKCVDAGAKANDCIENTRKKDDGWGYFGSIHDWELFGVCKIEGTWLGDDPKYMGCNTAQEITLDQLDEWLGLEPKVEWKNGDECEYKDEDDEWSAGGRYVCYDDFASHHVFYATNMTLYHATSDQLRKPETPEQKAGREKKEEIDDIKGTIDFFTDSYMAALSLYEQGYRKQ